ncbi:RHS repeat-associated core domain-containing protein [Psychrobacter sp. I-STPA6b]|uniref:RHS repeat-associated core domain-containing protein n=1 Tax=Psychrobacter sp. I-STPA6b TaxID=2585718 RepID=UPI001D0C24D0|nr:RHS repeat-associated core domain-containing protein [Psychrobacter sp. I-STPA6b]
MGNGCPKRKAQGYARATWVDQSGAFGTDYKFTGKELDKETGLYYFGARYYDPRTQVWQSPDPILGSYLDGERGMGGVYNPPNLNLYAYTHNNPVNLVDPDGEDVFESSRVDLGDGLKRMSLNNTELAKMALAAGNSSLSSWYITKAAAQNALTFGTDTANTPFESYNMAAGLRDGNYEQARNSGISLLMLGLGAKASPPRARAVSISGASIYSGTAGNLARAFANNLRNSSFRGKGKSQPRAASVAVDLTTGQSYYGISGWSVRSQNIHPLLRSRMPNKSLTGCPNVDNCAEFNAVNNALNNGSIISNLEVHTVIVKTDEPFPRCANCRVTTDGGRATSD